MLTLDPKHRAELRGRGMPDTEIDRRGYRSLPPEGPPWTREDLARRLADIHGVETLLGVPGIVRRTSKTTGKTYLTIAGMAGMLIPVRDLAGRLIALLDKPDKPPSPSVKYLWITSARDRGPGPGAPAHVPLTMPSAPVAKGGIVCVYEGVLKSDVAAALDPERLPAVGIPGHNGWPKAIPILRAMAPRVVRYFPDPDAWDPDPRKASIGASLRAFWAALKSEGFIPELGGACAED